jgi:hypothetical protein
VTATISLKDGVTDDEVRKALEPFLDEHNLDFDEQVCVGNIEITDGKLCLHLDVFGDGGYADNNLDELAERLAAVVDGWGWFEFVDDDLSGDSDAARTPYFIGLDENAQETARLEYGIERMAEWVRPIIGDDAFEVVATQIVALPRVATETAK